MRGASPGLQPQPQRAFSGACQVVVSWFAIDQILGRRFAWVAIRDLRTQAGLLFIDCKQQTYFLNAVCAQTLSRYDLGSDDAFSIARSPAKDPVFIFAGADMRGDGIHVR